MYYGGMIHYQLTMATIMHYSNPSDYEFLLVVYYVVLTNTILMIFMNTELCEVHKINGNKV